MLPACSFVVPCFNEAARIGDTIVATLDYLGQISPPSELIVVNDGSTDATSQSLGERWPAQELTRAYGKWQKSRRRNC
jgi:cellulose synthase/poly-beta-1,6-N-acetylglucosamine synthase-like glycosyltransferase